METNKTKELQCRQGAIVDVSSRDKADAAAMAAALRSRRAVLRAAERKSEAGRERGERVLTGLENNKEKKKDRVERTREKRGARGDAQRQQCLSSTQPQAQLQAEIGRKGERERKGGREW